MAEAAGDIAEVVIGDGEIALEIGAVGFGGSKRLDDGEGFQVTGLRLFGQLVLDL